MGEERFARKYDPAYRVAGDRRKGRGRRQDRALDFGLFGNGGNWIGKPVASLPHDARFICGAIVKHNTPGCNSSYIAREPALCALDLWKLIFPVCQRQYRQSHWQDFGRSYDRPRQK